MFNANTIPNPSTVAAGPPQRNVHLQLEPGNVYIALFRLATDYHWALVVATHTRTGMMYHNTNVPSQVFHFEARLHSHLLNSTTFLLAIKLSKITSYNRPMHQYFVETLSSVPASGRTCRTWLMVAVHELAEGGLIDFQSNPTNLEALEVEVQNRTAFASTSGNAIFVSQFYKG